MTTKEFMISLLSKIYEQHKLIFDLTVANEALLLSMKEAFPELAYDKHRQAAMRTESARKVLESLRREGETLEKVKQVLKDDE